MTKPERKHHALQLNFAHNCEWNEENKSWRVFHDGRMQHVSNSVVLTAVREANCGHWIDRYDDGKEWIYLGFAGGWKEATETVEVLGAAPPLRDHPNESARGTRCPDLAHHVPAMTTAQALMHAITSSSSAVADDAAASGGEAAAVRMGIASSARVQVATA